MTSNNPFEVDTTTETHKQSPEPLGNKNGLSRVTSMTVGDVRQCFQQMRNTADLRSSTVLWCGITAGQFALLYLLQTAHSSSRRRITKQKDKVHKAS